MIKLWNPFTEEEIAAAREVLSDGNGRVHERLLSIVRPIMPRIDADSGQENDVAYMAYCLEYLAG